MLVKFLFKPNPLAGWVLWAIASGALAQTQLPTVVVTTTAESLTQPSVERARESLKSISGGVSVVDLNQVREGRQSTWSDSLGLAPGVFIQDRFGSEEARISIRGSALSRTFHSFGIQILQDGVPVNYADGFFDMQTVDPNASRYVEVLRGPNATSYGAATLGGAINFVTPTGYTQTGGVARAEVGSFGYHKAFASHAGVSPSGSGPVWDHYVATSLTEQDGFRDHAAMANQKLIANVGVKLSRDWESRFYGAAVRSLSQLPGYLTLAELRQNPAMASSARGPGAYNNLYPFREPANRRRDVETQRLANKTTFSQGPMVYELALYAMHSRLWHPIDNIVEQSARTQGGHLKATYFGDRHQISLAYLPNSGSTLGSSKPSNHQGAAIGPAFSQYDQQSTNERFFGEHKYRASAHTVWTAALQYDRARRKVVDVLSSPNNYDHRFEQWSPRLGVTHEASETSQWFASLSRQFEAPVFGLAGTATQANLAQTGTTLEFGTRGEGKGGKHVLAWDATYYRAQLANAFVSACVVAGCTTPTTTNVPKTLHQGLELGLHHRYDRHFDTRVALLYSDFRFVNSAYYGNNALPGFPPLILRGEWLYRFGQEVHGAPSTYVGPKFEWVPRKAPMDNANTLYNEAYAVLGLKAGQAINQKWSWFADARNLTRQKYAATTNIAASYATAPLGAYYYPGEGRALYLGVEAKLD